MPPLGALKDTRTTPSAGLPVPPGQCAWFLEDDAPPKGPKGYSNHPLGYTPRPPQAGVPGSWKMMPPHGP